MSLFKKTTGHVLSALLEAVTTVALVLIVLSAATSPAHAGDLSERLVREAPTLNRDVAKRASQALSCSLGHGKKPDMLLVVDMSKPSTKERLYAFDLKGNRLVTRALVAHGRGSDPKGRGVPQVFGNAQNSGMTSLGLYRIAEAYTGKHGPSRRLDGLTQGWNDKARNRAVVLHPSNYVNKGAVGRSLGCPAVEPETLALLEKAGLNNAVLWIDGDDKKLGEALARCDGALKDTKKEEHGAFRGVLAVCLPPNPYHVPKLV